MSMISANTRRNWLRSRPKPEAIRVAGKISFVGYPQIEHFKVLKSICNVTPKMAIPSPSMFHFRQGRNQIGRHIYPDMDEYFADVAATYRSINSACRRNAALRPPKKAMCSPRRSSGPSYAWSWNCGTKCGESRYPISGATTHLVIEDKESGSSLVATSQRQVDIRYSIEG
jgi:hypothetical protein